MDIRLVMSKVEAAISTNSIFGDVRAREGTTISTQPDDYTDWRFHRGVYDFNRRALGDRKSE